MTNSTAPAAAPMTADDFYADPFPGHKGSDRIVTDCGKCAGTGLYSGYTGWTDSEGRPYCFDCKGTGKYSILVSSARATARKQARAKARQINESYAEAVASNAFDEAHPGLRIWLNQFLDTPGFLGDMAHKPASALTPKMLETIERIRAEREVKEAEKAATAAVEEGRRVIEGTVRSVKSVDGEYGTTWKMTIDLDNGTRLFGTIGRDIDGMVTRIRALEDGEGWYDRLIGQRVLFTASVERSRDDHTFGFWKRPTKGMILDMHDA